LAIDESSTFMKVAADSAKVPHRRAEPDKGSWTIGAVAGGAGGAGRGFALSALGA
jgi:hypothetical protein